MFVNKIIQYKPTNRQIKYDGQKWERASTTGDAAGVLDELISAESLRKKITAESFTRQ